MKKIIIISILIGFLLITPSTLIAPASNSEKPDDTTGQVFLFINGGFGCHFTVINDGNTTVEALYSVKGHGFFVNKTYYENGTFLAPPGVWTSAPPVLIPYTFMFITAHLSTSKSTGISRTGVSILGWVIFFI